MAGTTIVETFDNVSIKKIAFLFKGDTTGSDTDCNGQLSGETEMKTIVKKCGATEVKSKAKPIGMTVTITAHVPVEVFRKFYGLEQDAKLKTGIYSYGPSSTGKDFSLAVQVVDDFEENEKLLAFLSATSNTGLTFTIENGADEVAALELETKILVDEFGYFYHEAIVPELEEDLTDKWMSLLSGEILSIAGTTTTSTTTTTTDSGK